MRIVLAALLAVIAALPAWAAEIMGAPEARAAAERGEIVLIDIRTPEEWRQTGIADVALPVTMHDRAFLTHLQGVIADHPGKRLAFICATGGRTAFIASELAKMGLTDLIDVSEGMAGSRAGPGWIARGLPVRAFGG